MSSRICLTSHSSLHHMLNVCNFERNEMSKSAKFDKGLGDVSRSQQNDVLITLAGLPHVTDRLVCSREKVWNVLAVNTK
jgi:hypothetical protein